jgi:hypothetical protein
MLGNHLTEHRTDLTSRPLRFWLVRDYLIAYAPDEKRLWVVAGHCQVEAKSGRLREMTAWV